MDRKHDAGRALAGVLHKEVRERIQELSSLMNGNTTGTNTKRIETLRREVLADLVKIIELDPSYAEKATVENSVWKYGFYIHIEHLLKQYRSTKKRYLTERQKDKGRANKHIAPELNKIRSKLDRLFESCTKFYTDMLETRLRVAQVARTSSLGFSDHFDLNSDAQTARNAALALHSAHRCLVYLGDLERYRQRVVDSKQKRQWESAEGYYKQAIELLPSNGNPFNQLAVCSTYRSHAMLATHRYIRSIAVSGTPFASGSDNLALILKRMCTSLENSDLQSASLDRLIVACVGTLFLTSGTDTDIERFHNIQSIAQEKLVAFAQAKGAPEREQLMQQGQFSTLGDLLLAVLTDGIFCVHYNFEKKRRSMLACSLEWVLTLGTVMAQQAVADASFQALGPLTVLFDWICSSDHYEAICCSALTSQHSHEFWSRVAELTNTVAEYMLSSDFHSKLTLDQYGDLPEEREMRSFRYLEDAYAHLFQDFALRRQSEFPSLQAQHSRNPAHSHQLQTNKRLLKVQRFAQQIACKHKMLEFSSNQYQLGPALSSPVLTSLSAPSPPNNNLNVAPHSMESGPDGVGNDADDQEEDEVLFKPPSRTGISPLRKQIRSPIISASAPYHAVGRAQGHSSQSRPSVDEAIVDVNPLPHLRQPAQRQFQPQQSSWSPMYGTTRPSPHAHSHVFMNPQAANAPSPVSVPTASKIVHDMDFEAQQPRGLASHNPFNANDKKTSVNNNDSKNRTGNQMYVAPSSQHSIAATGNWLPSSGTPARLGDFAALNYAQNLFHNTVPSPVNGTPAQDLSFSSPQVPYAFNPAPPNVYGDQSRRQAYWKDG